MQNINRFLARINLTTSIGNYLSFFAIIKAIYIQTNSALAAGYLMGIQSLGWAFGSLIFPYIGSTYNIKKVLIFTQTFSLPALLSILLLLENSSKPLYFVYLLFFFISFSDKVYSLSSEMYSKNLSDKTKTHKQSQAEILFAFYGSQVLGPLLALILLLFFPYYVPLLIDATTFFISIILVFKLPSFKFKIKVESFKNKFIKPYKTIKSEKNLLNLLLARSIIFFIPCGIMNIYLFQAVSVDLNLNIEFSTMPYVLLATGGAIGMFSINKSKFLNNIQNSIVCAYSNIFLGLAFLPFIFYHNLTSALITFALYGFFMGSNALCSQTLRRQIVPKEIFPGFLGIEFIFAMGTEWLISKIALILDGHYTILAHKALVISVFASFITSFWYFRLAKDKVDFHEVKFS